jgi:anti-anti-sigma factor
LVDGMNDLVEVRLLRLPVRLHDRASRHARGLQREFELIRRGNPDLDSVPHRLHALIDELNDEFGGVSDQPVQELEDAIERGDERIDLVYRVPATAGHAARRLGDLLDEVDDYCRAGEHLLTLVTPPDALQYRRWFLAEFVGQTEGADPIAWQDDVVPADEGSGTVVRPPAPAPPSPLPPGWSVERAPDVTIVVVDGALDLVSAPALRGVLTTLIPERPRVLVDLTSCDFVDSVGVSVLVAAVQRADEHGVAVSFRLGDAAERVVRISGLLDRLQIDAGP